MSELLAVVGSRSFNNYELLRKHLDKRNITQIISGGARGTDTLAAKYAKEKKIELLEFLPDWTTHGKAAGFIRNKQIINAATHVIAFWDGTSHGTLNSINLAKKAKKEPEIIRTDEI